MGSLELETQLNNFHRPALLELAVMNEVCFGPRFEHTEELKIFQVAAVNPSPRNWTSGITWGIMDGEQ